MIKKGIKLLLELFIIFFLTLCLFEITYRHYIIDFYKNTFRAINTESDLELKKVDCLIFGDSFSAFKNGYVSQIKDKYPNKKFLNFSVSGTGIRQTNLFAVGKIEEYKPDEIIYQVYVGNDLIDIENLTNWDALSLKRNLYWSISDVFLSLRYLNQNLSIFNSSNKINQNLESDFDVNKYTSREKLLFKADPKYLEKSLKIKSGFESRYNKWENAINQFINAVSEDKKIHIIFIPHKAQVNEFYLSTSKRIGAKFSSNKEIFNLEYNFLNKAKLDFKDYKNVIFLNPLEYFRNHDNESNRLYYENDSHLNELGQKVLCDYISNEIMK